MFHCRAVSISFHIFNYNSKGVGEEFSSNNFFIWNCFEYMLIKYRFPSIPKKDAE